MREMLREHVLRKPPEKAQMIVEIWAESGRNARVAEFTRQLDRDVLEGMVDLVDLAKAKGAPRDPDFRFASRVLFTLVAGLFKRRRSSRRSTSRRSSRWRSGCSRRCSPGPRLRAWRSEMGRFLLSLVVLAALAAGGVYAQWTFRPCDRRCWRSTNGA